MRLSSERSRWLAALVILALCLAATYMASGVVFQTNDDNAIVSAACGGVTGEPYAGNGFTGYLYGLALSGLYSLSSGVAWHAILLSAAQALSLIAILRSLFFACNRAKRSPLWGAAAFIALYIGLGVKFTAYLQFTATPGYCAAALAALLWTLPEGARARRLNIVIGLALMGFALTLRVRGGLLALPVPLMACAVKGMKREGAQSRAALAAGAAALVLAAGIWLADGALYRAAEPHWEEQSAFDEASAELLDYNNNDETYALAAEVTDWSPELIACVRNWSLLFDERFNTQSLTAISDAIKMHKQAPTLYDIAYKTGSVVKNYSEFGLNALAFTLAGLFALISRIRKRRWLDALLLVALPLSTLAVIAYFYGWLGRFPDRVAFAYAFPAYALALVLYINYSSDYSLCSETPADAKSTKYALPAGAAAIMLAAILTFASAPGDMLVLPNSNREGRASLSAEVNAYAGRNPDTLYVTDVTQGFYAFIPERAPANLLDWSSGMLRSPMYAQKLAKLGYGDGFSTLNLADDGVRLLLSSDASLDRLMACLAADGIPWRAITEYDGELFNVYRLE